MYDEKDLKEYLDFINRYFNENWSALRLKFSGREPTLHNVSAIDQIEARRKSAVKLSPFLVHHNFLFPSVLASEQASDARIALYHASLIDENESVADLTAGLGIDSMTIARVCKSVFACERFDTYADFLRHNSSVMGLTNYEVINEDSIEWLKNSDCKFDTIFIDPARRGKFNSRTRAFSDCEPDVVSNFNLIACHTKRIMIKSSPMLDITQIARELPSCSEIHIVSLRGECKEVFAICHPGEFIDDNNIIVKSVNILDDKISEISFPLSDCSLNPESYFSFDYSGLPQYLYEPDASLMKVAPWNALVHKYPQIRKVAPNTHLFVSDDYIPGFPGRTLKILDIPDKKTRKSLKGKPFNVVCRNYVMKPEELTRNLSLKSGSDNFIYAFRDSNNHPRIVIAQSIPTQK